MIRSEQGFSLVEILIALLVFAMVVVGTITIVGAATAGGFLDTFPTSFVTTRAARDYTAASVYLQSFQEFVANKGFASAVVTPSTWRSEYCVEGPAAGTGCTAGGLPAELGVYPVPSDPSVAATYQLNWDRLDVVIEQLHWDNSNATPALRNYCRIGLPGCGATQTGDSLKLVQSTLTWLWKDRSRSLTVKRFLRSP